MDAVTMHHDGDEGINYSNIVIVLATPMAIMLGMLVTATDPDQAPAAQGAALAPAAMAAPAPNDDLFGELKRRGHSDASAAMLATKFTSAVPDPTRRRELAMLASQLSTSLRWSDEEAATRVIAAAAKGQDAVDAVATAKR